MPRRRLRALAHNLALSAAAAVVSLGLLEGLARAWEPPLMRPPVEGPELIRQWRGWGDEFYRFGRGQPRWPPEGATNRDGLRDAHHTLERPEGTERLLILGDSVTYGLGLAPESAYPQLLQRRLDERGERLEVFNVAAPGWSTRQERLAYARLMRVYGARHALLAVCLNDPLELHQNLSRPPGWLLRLYERSALVRRLVDARGREARSVEELSKDLDAPVGRAVLARFFDEVGELRRELAADEVGLALVVLPYRFQVQPGSPEPPLQARLRAFAAGQGLAFQDLRPALLPLGPAAFLDYNHLSPAGSAAAATALLEGPLLPARRSYPALLEARGLRPDAPPARLVELLTGPGPDTRAAAAWALQRAELDADAARALAQRAADGSEAVRVEALRALARAGFPETRPALLAALDDVRESVRLEAARALWVQPPQAPEAAPLLAAMRHEDAYVRAFAEESLARLGAPAVASVQAALSEPDAGLRRRLARLLGRLGPAAGPSALALTACLDDSDAGVRRQAARALGELGPAAQASLPALRRAAAQDAEPQVRAAAAQALERLQP